MSEWQATYEIVYAQPGDARAIQFTILADSFNAAEIRGHERLREVLKTMTDRPDAASFYQIRSCTLLVDRVE